MITQDLLTYEMNGEDAEWPGYSRQTCGSGIVRPNFWDRARYFGMDRELAEALDALNQSA